MAVRRPRRVLVMLGMGLTEKALFKKSGIYREWEGEREIHRRVWELHCSEDDDDEDVEERKDGCAHEGRHTNDPHRLSAPVPPTNRGR
jgi:hypothetical protein